MTKLARWQANIVDEEGNVQPSASVEVRLESTGNLAALYADSAGSGGLVNPLTADADGYVYFYVPSGDYKITATKGGFTREWRDVAIFTTEDLEAIDPYREVTAAGDVTITATDTIVGINKSVGANTNVNIPAAADRNGRKIVIKKVVGNMDGFTVTPVFSGAETCDGLSGASFAMTTNGGWLILYPRTGGYYTLGNQL